MSPSRSRQQTFWQARSHTQKSILLALCVFGAGAALIVSMGALKTKPEPEPPEEVLAPRVETVTVSPAEETVVVRSQGSVTPVHSIMLVAEVGGRVVEVASDYADGSFFQRNQAIVSIDPRDYEFLLKQAESDVARAREALAVEKGRARQAKREWRDLGNREANELFLRKPQLAAAEAAVEAAIANRDKASLNLERTSISAPFNGRIQQKRVDVGQYVAPGTVIAEVYSTESVQVRLPLTDRQVGSVSLPLSASDYANGIRPAVTLKGVYGGREYQWQGHIVRTEGSLDVKSRVVYAVAEISDPFAVEPGSDRPPLAIGMYVSAEILGDRMDKVVRLPRKALHKKNQIVTVDAEDRILFKEVSVLQSDGEEILVTGLAEADRVLLTSVPYAVDGLKVNSGGEEEMIAAEKDEAEVVAEAPDDDVAANTVQDG